MLALNLKQLHFGIQINVFSEIMCKFLFLKMLKVQIAELLKRMIDCLMFVVSSEVWQNGAERLQIAGWVFVKLLLSSCEELALVF